MAHRHRDRPCNLTKFFREVRYLLVDIHSYSHHDILYRTGLALHRHLRQDTADLAATHHEVIDPLDIRPPSGRALHSPRNGHRCPSCDLNDLGRLTGRPEENRKIDSRILR